MYRKAKRRKDIMRSLSLQLSENASNNVSGINRNSSSRGSIRISPPVAPSNDIKTSLRTNGPNLNTTDSDQQSCSKSANSIGVSLQNNSRPTHLIDLGNSMSNYSYTSYYDSNNYFSHINKCQQLSKNGISSNQSVIPSTNICLSSGDSTSTSATAVIHSGTTSAIISNSHMSHSRSSLDDHGVDVGRVSPSSSSNDSRKSRYSSASLDSGRGSDTKTSGQSHRVSVHSCESIGSTSSNKDNYNRNSSSSSSIGSGNSATLDGEISTITTPTATDVNWSGVTSGAAVNGSLSIAEMVLHGIADEEIIHSWLSKIHFEEYANNFIQAGYDMPTISRMTPEDLTAIGITKPANRRILKTEIQKLSIADGIPNFKPNSLLEWLKILRLEEYFNTLCQQGYDSIDRVTELAWEDLEEVGIKKLGHQKKIMLAIKRIQSVNNNMSRTSDASNTLSLPLIYNNTGSCPDIISRPQNNSYQLGVHPQYQDVPIKMFAPTKSTPSPTTEKPITPQLTTFQQLPINSYMFTRQKSEGPYTGLIHNTDAQNSVFHSSRGRSLESLDNNETNYYQMYVGKQQQRHAFNMLPNLKQKQFLENDITLNRDNDLIHGYETDSELINSYTNSKKCLYEIDGTATLHRPKGLIKNKPIAKIAAKTRQTDSNCYNQIYINDQQKNNSPHITTFDKRFDSVPQMDNNYMSGENESNNYFQDLNCSQIYSSLKRKKTPPPPPKRVNSMRNSTNNSPLYSSKTINNYNSPQHSVDREIYPEFHEQVFATCVKSLASRFSMSNSEDMNSSSVKNSVEYSNEFPPPPSPLFFNEQTNKDSYNTLQRRKDSSDRECNISSSSSTESMPFANDNIGTIKQRVNNDSVNKEIHSPSPSYGSTPVSPISSSLIPHNTCNTIISQDSVNKNSVDSKLFARNLSPTKHSSRRPSIEQTDRKNEKPIDKTLTEASNKIRADPLDDIETMLVNLSNQLDLMLENDNHND